MFHTRNHPFSTYATQLSTKYDNSKFNPVKLEISLKIHCKNVLEETVGGLLMSV